MKILSKKELNTFLGKENMWNRKRLDDKVSYVTGIKPFDALLEGKTFIDNAIIINFSHRPNGLQIQMMRKFKYYSIGILNENITQITLEDKEQIFQEKEKSVIGRAVIGGFLLGPAGAIIGGMTGLGKKEVKAEMPEMLLSINYQLDKKEDIMVFSCNYKARKVVGEFFSSNYPDVFGLQK